jgi:hypothetical protein
MNCFDCAALGDHADAVAICADCGAAVCTITRTSPPAG